MAPDEIPPPGREEWGAWAESALRPTDNFDRPLASWGRRALAILIDAVVVALAGVALAAVALGGVSRPRSGAFNMAIGLLYYGLLNGSGGGQTLGKMALGVRVVGPDGGNPSFWRAALREVIGKWISSLILGLGYFWMLWDEEQQTWHDKIASTFVERS
ncbi:MAG TPA: RDD family protein [Acidimicrobiales bacterium]|nr:RDD family protein [Acidimicrobiales bacterium]